MADKKAEPTLKELKVKAIRLGYKGNIDLFTTKGQVESIIESVIDKPTIPESVDTRAGDESTRVKPEGAQSKEEAKQFPEPLTQPTPPKDDSKSDIKVYRGKAAAMKAKLDAQKLVRIFLPLEGKEKKGYKVEEIVNGRKQFVFHGAVRTLTFNGYSVHVLKGVTTYVPEQVADAIGQGDTDTSEAGDHIAIDRPDTENPETPYKTIEEGLT